MRHLIEELDQLKSKLLEMSSLVESAIYRSIAAVVQRDEDLAQKVLRDAGYDCKSSNAAAGKRA